VNIDVIKAESDLGVLSEEDSIDMSTDEVYIPSTFSLKMPKTEVSLDFCGYLCVHGHVEYKSFISMAVFWVVGKSHC
jgi:hypothetical protein